MNSKHFMFACCLEWEGGNVCVCVCVCMCEPDKGNMPYFKIIYQKKNREISNRKFEIYNKLHSVWISLVNVLFCLIKFEDFIFLLLDNAIVGELAVQ